MCQNPYDLQHFATMTSDLPTKILYAFLETPTFHTRYPVRWRAELPSFTAVYPLTGFGVGIPWHAAICLDANCRLWRNCLRHPYTSPWRGINIGQSGSYDKGPMTSHPGSMCTGSAPPPANLWGGNTRRWWNFGKYRQIRNYKVEMLATLDAETCREVSGS
jgi:hypothetical protein